MNDSVIYDCTLPLNTLNLSQVLHWIQGLKDRVRLVDFVEFVAKYTQFYAIDDPGMA